jgi:KaiC/GvpD/RAD55 family RecA-like ATPase
VAEVQSGGRVVAQTGAGKTTLAAAVALALLELGHGVAWVACRDLDPTHPDQERARAALRRAETAKVVVFDGLGKELGGASQDSGPGVAAQRKQWVMRLVPEADESEGRRFIFTVDSTSGPLQDAYGADFFRRIARNPRAAVIRLRRTDAIDFERF